MSGPVEWLGAELARVEAAARRVRLIAQGWGWEAAG